MRPKQVMTLFSPAFAVALLILTAGSVAAQDVRYNFMPGTNFSNFHTYKWVVVPNATYPNQIVGNPGDGCTMAALAPEVARSTPELKDAFEKGLEEILSASGERKEAIFHTAALLGGIVLARAVQDPHLSDEILRSVQQKLS
jgi:hypothetical protein